MKGLLEIDAGGKTSDEKFVLKETALAYFLAVSALYIFFIADACNKILFFFEFDYYRISIIPRGIYELFFFATIALFLNRNRATFLVVFLFCFLCFIIGQITFAQHAPVKYDFPSNIAIFNKYFFLFVTYFALYRLKEDPRRLTKLITHFERLLYFNSLAALAGLVFHIEFLRTYVGQDYRYGYSGFIPAQNEATLFFFIAIAYFYYKHYILNQRSNRIFVVGLAGLLVGTKGIYIVLICVLLFHLLYNSNLKMKLASLMLVGLILAGVTWYLTTEHSQVVLSYFKEKADENGWLYVLVSGRNTYIQKIDYEVVEPWTLLNYFVGGQDQSRFTMEMDFFDLYFFFGAIGSLIYLALYLTTVFKFKLNRLFNLFFLFLFFSLAFFGGHFFASAINSLYLCLISFYLYTTQTQTSVYPDEKSTVG